MFKEAIDRWQQSDKNKESKIKLLHELNDGMMEVRELRRFIGPNSVVDSFIVDKDGIFVILNETRGKIKMYFEENDCEAAPVEVMCSLDYERIETQTFLNIVSEIMHPNFMMLDIGANVGWYTLLTSNIYKDKVNVCSFEPSPLTFERLNRNIELNDISNVRTFNIGLFNKKTSLKFFYDVEGSGGSSFVNLRGRKNVREVLVPVDTLDGFISKEKISHIDFIKCDVEGSELFVFEGGQNIIKRDCPVIFSEMLRKWSAKFNYTPNDIIVLFNKMGYECYAIEDENKLRYCPVVTEETQETNYYFLNSQKHDKIIEKFVI